MKGSNPTHHISFLMLDPSKNNTRVILESSFTRLSRVGEISTSNSLIQQN